jgi:hypothetical protein
MNQGCIFTNISKECGASVSEVEERVNLIIASTRFQTSRVGVIQQSNCACTVDLSGRVVLELEETASAARDTSPDNDNDEHDHDHDDTLR